MFIYSDINIVSRQSERTLYVNYFINCFSVSVLYPGLNGGPEDRSARSVQDLWGVVSVFRSVSRTSEAGSNCLFQSALQIVNGALVTKTRLKLSLQQDLLVLM